MYELLNWISRVVMEPVIQLSYSVQEWPLLYALMLGLVGAAAPCQLTSNIGAMTVYGTQSLRTKIPWRHIGMFLLGKIIVFSGLGFLFWWLGRDIFQELQAMFPWIRKAIGPLLVLIGVFLMGWIKFRKTITLFKVPDRLKSNPSHWGSFFLGAGFTLAFCPTMFVLFFLTLMPIVVATSYGAIMPTIFGLGTSIPLLLFIGLIAYFGLSGNLLRKGRHAGVIVQRVAGILLILVGILDTLTYW
ncbi:cytochrome c biosynthesis protein [Thalassobacillus devorans]|uniref:Cytochrome c biosynthesis protein n=1 Tax=Thalassobacillus devorans TaxID=279813 RepID=A0ABQ1NQF0_9BACI|nr:sulfite exporter TauE/SafE family protein [Thalassobacillus devorans]NIK28885.1 cytochrome c biogenesis protein CcdA [Thalassobacillus devorans]GGC82856.1 cytochrome c biosynthesis protein [Thalassobacillus devorans]